MWIKSTIAASFAFTLATVCASAGQAQKDVPSWVHDVEVETVLVCDNQRQVERFVALLHGNAGAAVSAVNAEESDPTACALTHVAYLRGGNLATIRTTDETFRIAEILVIGVATPQGVRAVAPHIYISAFKTDERAA
jgi:hypothetical protein